MELGNAVFGNSRGEVPIPRGQGYEEHVLRLIEALTGHEYESADDIRPFENETFTIAPYFWGDCDCGDEHVEGCAETRPNFHFKPDDYRLKWYKYPLRDSYANRQVSLADFAKMVDLCVASLAKKVAA